MRCQLQIPEEINACHPVGLSDDGSRCVRAVVETAKPLGWVVFSEEATCTSCMRCSDSCPTGALRVESREIDDGLCIRCMACTRACPVGILSLHYDDTPSSRERFERLDKIFAVRKEPQFSL